MTTREMQLWQPQQRGQHQLLMQLEFCLKLRYHRWDCRRIEFLQLMKGHTFEIYVNLCDLKQ